MIPTFETSHVTVYLGDCIEVMRELPEASVDAIVTDPPYGIGFMGAAWDTFAPEQVAHRSDTLRRKGTKRKSERWPSKNGRSGRGGGAPIETVVRTARLERGADGCPHGLAYIVLDGEHFHHEDGAEEFAFVECAGGLLPRRRGTR